MSQPRLISISVNWGLLARLLPRTGPPWLMSLVFHLSLVLLLALLQVAGSATSQGVALLVDCRSGDSDALGDEGEGLLDDATILPSEISLAKADKSLPAPESFAEPVAEVPQFELPGVARPAADGGALEGDGRGGSEGAAGEGDNPVRTEVFGLAAEGSKFVYVFDRSESMNSTFAYSSEGTQVFSITPLEAAKAELLDSLADLDQRHRFQIVFYNHEPWLFDPGRSPNRLIQATRANKRRAAAFVASVYGQGNTHHMKPLEMALRMRPDVIFLLTDGEAKDDPTAYQLQQIARLNDSHTRINVIQFCFVPRGDTSLVKLANENGGNHVFVNIARLGRGARTAIEAAPPNGGPVGDAPAP